MPVFRTVTDAQQGEVKLEAIHQPIYDQATVADATSNSLSLFQNPAGRGAFLTNVQTAGQLSWPKRFSIKAIRQVPSFSATAADVQVYVGNTGQSLFRLDVGEKNYLTLPAFILTAGVGLEVFSQEAGTGTAEGYTLGRPNQQNIYTLMHSIYLPPVQNFVVRIDTGDVSALSAALPVHIFLEGELLREVQ